jgi:hypothetical protein
MGITHPILMAAEVFSNRSCPSCIHNPFLTSSIEKILDVGSKNFL